VRSNVDGLMLKICPKTNHLMFVLNSTGMGGSVRLSILRRVTVIQVPVRSG
jgi:hypothetical protein